MLCAVCCVPWCVVRCARTARVCCPHLAQATTVEVGLDQHSGDMGTADDQELVLMEGGRTAEQVANEEKEMEQGSELGEADQLEQVELVASPPSAPPLPSPHAETVEQKEQRQELSMV